MAITRIILLVDDEDDNDEQVKGARGPLSDSASMQTSSGFRQRLRRGWAQSKRRGQPFLEGTGGIILHQSTLVTCIHQLRFHFFFR